MTGVAHRPFAVFMCDCSDAAVIERLASLEQGWPPAEEAGRVLDHAALLDEFLERGADDQTFDDYAASVAGARHP
ncbi:MAG TPA: hypothetical protein VM243_08445 [Phycisphaerae bacterium]|nr:hypothetical protein [Phycisphaerae bacterium]